MALINCRGRPMFWCKACGHVIWGIVEASAHQFPPISHTEISQIGISAPEGALP